jgi:hypothetical protein
VGCGVKNCGSRLNFYVVCEYFPAGNIGFNGNDANRFYRQNVQAQVEGKPSDTAVAAVAVGEETAEPTATSGGPAATGAEPAATSSKSEGSPIRYAVSFDIL